MKITAIIAARNEAKYLPVTLRHLADCGISLAIIDHESEDSSHEIYDSFRPHIIYQATLPFKGCFSLTEQIEAKARVLREVRSDWWIHQDADEILESPRPGESLRAGIERAASAGAEAINFDEFVFVPTRQHPDFEGRAFLREMLWYYFFQPRPMRLARAWRDSPDIQQAGGGHKLVSNRDILFSAEDFVLRHYIALSKSHADAKYAGRVFAREDLKKGWHENRRDVPAEVALPDEARLHRLKSWDGKDFIKAAPRRSHFWSWTGARPEQADR